MTTDSYSENAQENEIKKPASYFGVLGNLFFSPGNAFQEVRRSPLLMGPIVGLIVIGLLGGYAMTRMIDMSFMLTAQVESAVAQGRMTQQEADEAVGRMSASPVARFLGYLAVVSSPLAMLFTALVIAGVFKLVSLFVDAENTFRGVFSATLFAMTPYYIVSYALFAIVASFKDTSGLSPMELQSFVGSNLGILLDRDTAPGFLVHLAGKIDIIRIWLIALLSIGYAGVSNKLRTSTAAVWLSALYLLMAIVISAVQSAFSR